MSRPVAAPTTPPPEEEECKHGLGIRFCSWCQPASTAARRYDPDDGHTTTARYDGRCHRCHARINEGDTIHLADGDWLCEDCP